MMQMVKTMFQGFKVGIDLQVEGKIVKTNADYVNGSRITLLEIELAGLFEDEAKLKALQSKFGPGTTLTGDSSVPEGRQGREDQQSESHDRISVGDSGCQLSVASYQFKGPMAGIARMAFELETDNWKLTGR